MATNQTISATAPCWHIDQQAMAQGISSSVLQQVSVYATQRDSLWEKTVARAAEQPIVGSADHAVCEAIAGTMARLTSLADTLVVIGTGGASLGAQALCAFASRPVRVRFLENCDSQTVHDMFQACPPARTTWVIISKSGETVETLATSLALMAHYQAAAISLAERVVVITSPGERPLRALAEEQGWQTLDHPPTLGGRFSVFSVVGLLPVAFSGVDVSALAMQMRAEWNAMLTRKDPALFEAACVFAASIDAHPLHVVMGYADRLRPYTQWYKQLWAESLGKDGDGPTPITSIGAIDQHSQLQLYLDGKRDKIFTLILPEGEGVAVPLARSPLPKLAYLATHSIQDVMHASANATYDTLKARGVPIRMQRAVFGVESIARLMLRTMLETLLVATMRGVDPYSQPAVEEGKQRARRALGNK